MCSSVIPYVTDQLAMARLPRATFSPMLALLPVFATVIGAIVLRQVPTGQDAAGITRSAGSRDSSTGEETAWNTYGWARLG